jgi:hypothetical protein
VAQTIQIKRSTTTASPSGLSNGELAYSSNSNRLYIGRPGGGTGDIDTIGGKHFTDMLDHTLGTLTPSSAILVDASSKIDILNVDNITINGNIISTTNTNGDLTLQPNGVGNVVLDADETRITGNLTIQGTTTTVNSETITMDDNILVLNSNAAGSPTENAGIEIERGDSANVLLRWNEGSQVWDFTNDGSTYDVIATTSNIQGIVTGGSQTNITVASNGSVIDFTIATATSSTLGVARFDSSEFSVSGGLVNLATIDGGTY